MRNVLVLAWVAVFAQSAVSAPLSTPMPAVHLYSACREADTSEYAKGFCDGAIDAYKGAIRDWCVPPAVTHGEVTRHVKADLLQSPPPLGLSAIDFVSGSVQRRWPCPRTGAAAKQSPHSAGSIAS